MPEVHYIPVEILSVPANRWRRVFDQEALKALGDSISARGLIHPPVVRAKEDGRYEIIAGERRFRAMCSLIKEGHAIHLVGLAEAPPDKIPCLLIETITDPIELREIELDENIRRADLDWKERVEAVAALHALRIQQHEGNWSLTDTAQELAKATDSAGGNPTVIHNALLLAEHMSRPEVRHARSEQDGMKALYRSLEAEFTTALGAALPAPSTSDPNYTVEHTDAVAGLRGLKPGSVAVFITDPPYGIDADSFGAGEIATVKVHGYSDKWKGVRTLLIDSGRAMYKAAETNAHLYLMCDLIHFPEIKADLEIIGWTCWPRPIIWFKGTEGSDPASAKLRGLNPNAFFGPRRTYECILYAIKGKRPVLIDAIDVIVTPSIPTKLAKHAAQKPVELYTNLLKRSARAGELICDPFCGTGTVFHAASILKLRAIGFDLDTGCVFMSRERIKEITCSSTSVPPVPPTPESSS